MHIMRGGISCTRSVRVKIFGFGLATTLCFCSFQILSFFNNKKASQQLRGTEHPGMPILCQRTLRLFFFFVLFFFYDSRPFVLGVHGGAPLFLWRLGGNTERREFVYFLGNPAYILGGFLSSEKNFPSKSARTLIGLRERGGNTPPNGLWSRWWRWRLRRRLRLHLR